MFLSMAAVKLISDSVGSKTELIIPSILEPLTPVPLLEEQFLSFNLEAVADLYTTSPAALEFSYTEKGVAYGQQETSSQTVKCQVPLAVQPAAFQLNLIKEPIYQSGINYAGYVQVTHQSGPKFKLLLPGTRTYDPAGISGDPHCSERIGPTCSSALLKVAYASLVAAARGASMNGVDEIFRAFSPVNDAYHGRFIITQYMQHQIYSAVLQLQEPKDYPDFVKQSIEIYKIELTGNREHAKCYFESASKNYLLTPPRQYFRKIQDKDKNIDELLSAGDYQRFIQLV